MKRRLALLISELTGSDAWLSSDAWSRVVVVNSVGRIPPHVVIPGDYVWNRGFAFVLLDSRGRPRHFCKCRPAEDEILRHAIAVQGRLCLDPELAFAVPFCRGKSDGQILVQVSEYVAGERFDGVASHLDPSAWTASVQAILSAASAVSARAAVDIPGLLQDPAPVVLAAVSEPHLETLLQAGVPESDLDLVRGMLETIAPLPRLLQHGDLWTKNVIRGGGSWWLVDFDLFGEVQVPLYDTCCLVRSASERPSFRRRGSEGSWLEWLAADDQIARRCRDILSRESASFGLSSDQAIGALIFFLLDSAARIYSRLGSRVLPAAFSADVAAVCRSVRAGDSLERVFPSVHVSPRPKSVRSLLR